MKASECVLAFYFVWTSVMALSLPISDAVAARALLANAGVFGVYTLVYLLSSNWWVDRLRDWIPQALAILAYKQMGWFAATGPDVGVDHNWIRWDRLLLDDFSARAWIESLGVLLPVLLEASYALVYTLPPLTMCLLYRWELRKHADLFLTTYLLGLFLCYGQFPFWPSEPPRVVYAGQDLPGIHTVVRDLNLWIVGTQGIHTSVFPSAHVSGVVAAATALTSLLARRKGVVGGYWVYAAFVAIATVYGRYHYAVDAVGGLLLGVGAWPLAKLLNAQLGSRDEMRSGVEIPVDSRRAGSLDGLRSTQPPHWYT